MSLAPEMRKIIVDTGNSAHPRIVIHLVDVHGFVYDLQKLTQTTYYIGDRVEITFGGESGPELMDTIIGRMDDAEPEENREA